MSGEIDRAPSGKRCGRGRSRRRRKRAAVETYARNEAALRRTARRYSLCADDAEEALQRALEILLTKAPSEDPRELIRWTQTVVKHEALAVRRERERILAGRPRRRAERDARGLGGADPRRRRRPRRAGRAAGGDRPQPRGAAGAEAAGAAGPDPARRGLLLRRDRRDHRLQPHEDQPLPGRGPGAVPQVPLAQRGRQPLRRDAAAALGLLRRRGSAARRQRRCASTCAPAPSCRATLRAYRAAPRAAAALAPALPLERSLLERVHDALAGLAARLRRRWAATDSALPQVAAGGGVAAPAAALAKVVAVCVGTAGGAAACVATGVVPAPLELGQRAAEAPALERPIDRSPRPERSGESGVGVRRRASRRTAAGSRRPSRSREPAAAEPAAPEPAPAARSNTRPTRTGAAAPDAGSQRRRRGLGGGSAAGEFGP